MKRLFFVFIVICCFCFSGCKKEEYINNSVYELSGIYNGSFKGNAPYATSAFSFFEDNYEVKIFFDDDEIPSVLDETQVIYENGGWKYTENGTFQIINKNGIYFIERNNSKLLST